MIRVFMRNRVKTRRRVIKIRPALKGRGKEKERKEENRTRPSRQQVCHELSRSQSPSSQERGKTEDGDGHALPWDKEGVKF